MIESSASDSAVAVAAPPAARPAEVIAADAARPPVEAAPFALHVLQVLPRLVSGGVERGTIDIAQAVVRAGGRATVVSAGGPMVRELERAGAVHVTLRVDRKSPLALMANVRPLARLIRDQRVDIVHARSRAPAWSARAAARRAGVPFVTTFHGTYNFATALKRRYNAIMAAGERVIAISDFIGEHIRAHYGAAAPRITVIHRGVDLDIFSPQAVPVARILQLAQKWRLPDGVPAIMLPGRLTRWKGQAVLLQALAHLRDLDFVALLVGDGGGRAGYKAELEKKIAALGLENRVWMVGETRDMAAAFMLADIVVSASTDPEGFGRVVAEAQAMGRPVIATDHGAARETVVPGETGWLVPPGDPAALAAAIRAALALTPDERRRMAAAAERRVRTHFGKAQMCAKTLAVYREVAAATGRTRP